MAGSRPRVRPAIVGNGPPTRQPAGPPRHGQLLKWVGNKQRSAAAIVRWFPAHFGTYHEPFLGSGAVLATLAPVRAVGADAFGPLVEIWQTLARDPATLVQWYRERWQRMQSGDKVAAYEAIKQRYNSRPNGADLLFLCRSCYGGVVRFRRADGYLSTPCGAHRPVQPEAFARRVEEWHRRTAGTRFLCQDYRATLAQARPGDLVYCDPPYRHTQTILYGAQAFDLADLLAAVAECKRRGVFVALSLDGTKKSGRQACPVPVPAGLFEREVLIPCGRSMLRRFQMGGRTLEGEGVAERLLLTHTGSQLGPDTPSRDRERVRKAAAP